jgi:hypothetical protein
MELNDIVELRGNYYHLRAINDYNLKNGECTIQLLGPILGDVINTIINRTSTTTTSTSTTTSSTTTTTAVVNPCRCYEVVFGASGGEINYNDCAGETFNFVSLGASTRYQCVQVIGGLAQIFVVSGDVTLSIVGNCLTQTCPPATTTSTTTTTLAPCYQNFTFQVTNAGSFNWITCYNISDGGYYPNGEYTITGCIKPETFGSADGGTFTRVTIGTPCTTTTTTSTTTTTTSTTTTSTTTTTTPPLAANAVYGYMQPCVGGTIDDFMGAFVGTNTAVSVDTNFGVDVKYVFPGNSCGVGQSTQSFTITIESGSQSSNFNACLNGAYFSSGANICSACVTSCDNPAVDISAVDC